MFKIIKWLFLILALPLAYASFLILVKADFTQLFTQPFIFIVGATLSLRLTIYFKKPAKIMSFIGFMETLEHELSHAVMGLIFLQPPKKLMASDYNGGQIEIEQSNSHFKNHMITIAPYILPLWTSVFFLISLISIAPYSDYFAYLAVFSWTNFIVRLFSEFHFKQSDLQYLGFVFSFIATLLAVIVQSALLINYFYAYGFDNLIYNIKESYKFVFQFIFNWI